MSRPHVVSPAERASLRDLELLARTTVEGLRQGLHRSPFHGYSAEFSQYRPYRPGDDLKYVDWKLLARTDRIYTKQYRETTNLAAQIAVDASASMNYAGPGGVTKLGYARLVAAALAHLIVDQGDAAGLVVFSDTIRDYVPSRSGRAHLRRLLVALTALEATGSTAAAPALRRATDLLKRRGLLILVSDLYDEDGAVEEELRRATRIGHDVAVFHILTRDEIEFPFDEDVRIDDLESGASVQSGPAAAAEYRREFATFLDRWRTRCLANGIDYVRVTTNMALDTALREYLLHRSRGVTR